MVPVLQQGKRENVVSNSVDFSFLSEKCSVYLEVMPCHWLHYVLFKARQKNDDDHSVFFATKDDRMANPHLSLKPCQGTANGMACKKDAR